MIGFMNDIKYPKLVKEDTLKMSSFYLNNSNGEKCRVIAWNAKADRIEPLLKIRSVRTYFI